MTIQRRRFGFVWTVCALVAGAATPARADEIWVAPTYQQDVGGLGVGSSGLWPVTAVGAVRLAWAVPNDLQTFQGAKVVLIPNVPGGAANLNVFVCPAQNSDLVTSGCAGPFAQPFTGVANHLLEVDISAVIASRIGVAGANYLAVVAYTTPTTATDHIVGLRFAYARPAPSGVATLAANTFTGTQTAPAFVGDGSGLTNLPIPSGAATLGANTFTGTQAITGGNLGVATTGPLGKLQVVTANDTAPGFVPAWDARHVVFGGAANVGGIGLSYDQTNGAGYVQALSPGAAWRNLVFQSGGGNVGIASTTPRHRLGIGGGPPWTTEFWGGAIELDNASAIGWRANASGNRFGIGQNNSGLSFFATASDPGTTTSPTLYNMTISNNGNVGIGTSVPLSKLDVAGQLAVAGQDALRINGFQPFLTLNDTSSARRSLIQGANGGMGFFTHNSIGSTAPVTLHSSGRLGLGTTAPNHRLSIANAPAWTTANWGGAIELENAAAIGWRSNTSGNRFGIGQTNGGLFFFATASDPGTTSSPSLTSMMINDTGNIGMGTITPQAKLHVVGNAKQDRADNGFVKAMAYVNGDGAIIRCYSAYSAAANCGLVVDYFPPGLYYVHFGFQISDRFFSATVQGDIWNNNISFFVNSSATLKITIYRDSERTDAPFMVMVH